MTEHASNGVVSTSILPAMTLKSGGARRVGGAAAAAGGRFGYSNTAKYARVVGVDLTRGPLAAVHGGEQR